MLAFMFLAIGIRADFEGGRVGKVEQLAPAHVRCEVPGEADKDNRNRQPSWFYFRMDGVAGQDLTVDLVGHEGEYNYRPHNGSGHKTMVPVYSYDNRNWKHFDKTEWIPKPATIRLKFRLERDPVWLARIPVYTNTDLRKLLDSLRGHAHFRAEIAGTTVEGRPIPLLTITNPALPESGKRVIWLMARQHAWEAGTSWVAEGALRFLLSSEPAAARIRDRYIIKMIPMADPDGVARGGVRFNKNGYDLNRNWDTADAKLMPEIWAERKAVLDWVDSGQRVDLFLTLHNTESADYIEGPLAGGPEMKALGQRFWKFLDERTAFYSLRGPRTALVSTTPGMKGRMSVNQGLYHDRKIAAFLMELMVDPSPKLSRPPTVADRLEFGRLLIQVMCDAVAGGAD